MKLKAVGYRMLIKLDAVEEVLKSGLVIASDKERKRQEVGMEKGTVIDIGPNAYEELEGDPWVKVGDRIMFQRYAGVIVEDGKTKFRAINDTDVYAIIVKD